MASITIHHPRDATRLVVTLVLLGGHMLFCSRCQKNRARRPCAVVEDLQCGVFGCTTVQLYSSTVPSVASRHPKTNRTNVPLGRCPPPLTTNRPLQPTAPHNQPPVCSKTADRGAPPRTRAGRTRCGDCFLRSRGAGPDVTAGDRTSPSRKALRPVPRVADVAAKSRRPPPACRCVT